MRRCRHDLKMAKDVTVLEVQLAFTPYPYNLKTVENLIIFFLLQSIQHQGYNLIPHQCILVKESISLVPDTSKNVPILFRVFTRFRSAKSLHFSCERKAICNMFMLFFKLCKHRVKLFLIYDDIGFFYHLELVLKLNCALNCI